MAITKMNVNRLLLESVSQLTGRSYTNCTVVFAAAVVMVLFLVESMD